MRIGRSLRGRYGALVWPRRRRHLIPHAIVQCPTGSFLEHTTPLLEKERHAIARALVADISHPSGLHRAGAWPRFAADDHPIDSLELNVRQRTEQRLKR